MGVRESLRKLVGGGRDAARRPSGAAIGWGGAKVFSGIVLDEYNPDLKGRLALQTAEKMRRTSGQVRALEQVIRLPIQSTQWFIEEPRGAGSAEREAAELLRENLFAGMERPWSDVVREACLAGESRLPAPNLALLKGRRVDVMRAVRDLLKSDSRVHEDEESILDQLAQILR